MSWRAGIHPDAAVPAALVQAEIRRYGYDQMPSAGIKGETTRRVIAAFQMHFQQRDYSGRADTETWSIARTLNEQYGRR